MIKRDQTHIDEEGTDDWPDLESTIDYESDRAGPEFGSDLSQDATKLRSSDDPRGHCHQSSNSVSRPCLSGSTTSVKTRKQIHVSDTPSHGYTESDTDCVAALYLKFPSFITSKQLQDHINNHGFGSDVVDIDMHVRLPNKMPAGSAKVLIAPPSLQADFISSLNGSRVQHKHRLSVQPYKHKGRLHYKDLPDRIQRKMQRKASTISQFAEKKEPCKIFVEGNLPQNINREHLQKHFIEYKDAITNIELKSEKRRNRFALITLKSPSSARRAIDRYNQTSLLGKYKIKVDMYRPYLPLSSSASCPDMHYSVAKWPQEVAACPEHQSLDDNPKFPSKIKSSRRNIMVISSTAEQPEQRQVDSGHSLTEFHSSEISLSSSVHGYGKQMPAAASQKIVTNYIDEEEDQLQNTMTVVIVENLHPCISPEDIEKLTGVKIVGYTPSDKTLDNVAAYIEVTNSRSACTIADKLNGSVIHGKKLSCFMTDSNSLRQQAYESSLSCQHEEQLLMPDSLDLTTEHSLAKTENVPLFYLGDEKHTRMSKQSPTCFSHEATTSSLAIPLKPVNEPQSMLSVVSLEKPQPVLPTDPMFEPQYMSSIVPGNEQFLLPIDPVYESQAMLPFMQMYPMMPIAPPYDQQPTLSPVYPTLPFASENEQAILPIAPAYPILPVNVSPVYSPQSTSPVPPVQEQQTSEPAAQITVEKSIDKVQWCHLTTTQKTGKTLLQEIIAPFETNPNVEIQLQVDTCTIKLCGVHEAVISAHDHITNQLNRTLHVQDRILMAALVELNPTLPQDIDNTHGVTVNGFHETSSAIRFDGSTSAIEMARKEVDNIISQAKVTTLIVAFSHCLLELAKRSLKCENCLTYISSEKMLKSSNTVTVTVCSFNKTVHKRAVSLLQTTPTREEVVVSPAVSKNPVTNETIKHLEDKHCVMIEEERAQEIQDNKLVIIGFRCDKVKDAHIELIQLIKLHSEQRVKFDCKPEELLYLLKVTSKESRSLLLKLPAKASINDEAIELYGNIESIEKSKEIILNGPLHGLQWNRFSFKCNIKFQTQMETCILRPFRKEQKLDFQYLIIKAESVSSRKSDKDLGTVETNVDCIDFDIIIFSKDKIAFDKVCDVMEALDPQTRKFKFSHREAAACARKLKETMEGKYYVRIIVLQGNHGLIIHGLIPNEIQECWEKINDEIRSSIEIVKHINLKEHECKYLERKCCEDLKKSCSCDIAFPRQRRDDHENYAVRITGKIKDVEAAEQRISNLLETGIQLITFNIECIQKSHIMWRKWWFDFRMQEEESNDVLINFDKAVRRHTRDGSSTISVTFELIGTNLDHLRCIRDTISNEKTEKRVFNVLEESKVLLQNAASQQRLPISQKLAVGFDIDPFANKVTLVSPKSLSGDLDTAESEIRKFVGMYASISKNVGSHDPIVGLILASSSMFPTFIKSAQDIARPHKVSVAVLKAPPFGLKLTGSPSAIEKVEPQIHATVFKQIEKSINETQVQFPSTHTAVLRAHEFLQLEKKLRNEYCVLLFYSKLGSLSKAEYTAVVKPTSSSHSLVLDICHGDIVHEKVDAIVNAANEDLKHIGGLAKSIADNGGTAIQSESSNYVKIHGKVSTGSCACLGAGKLPCKRVIHAVGPQWRGGTRNEEQILYNTVYKTLQCADKENLKSVAFPAISTGVYGVPEDVCARASLTAVCDYCQSNPASSISTVRFILFTKSSLKHFGAAIEYCNISERSDDCSSLQTLLEVKDVKTGFTWSWENDTKSFSSYSSDISAQLTKEYESNPAGSLNCIINGQRYCIDFSKMTQTNQLTRFQRKVRRVPYFVNASPETSLSTESINWEYRDDHHGWSPYKASDSAAIEEMYQDDTPGELAIVGNTYTFDFKMMHQINTRTHYKRKIRRTEGISSNSEMSEKLPSVMDSVCSKDKREDSTDQKDLIIKLRGPCDTLPQAKSELEDSLESMYVSHTISFPAVLETKLSEIAEKHNVVWSFEKSGSGKKKKGKRIRKKVFKLNLEGLASEVSHAAMVIQEEIITHQIESESEGATEYPEEWEEMASEDTTKVFQLHPGTDEWTYVLQKFQQTMRYSSTVIITRIQNKWLWEKYVFQCKRLHIKNNGDVNERELFHGTGTNDPKLIYENEVGFDMRYSAQGMWGQANYFAEKASYSDNYAHRTLDGYKEMFLVKVLTGDSHNCTSDPSLRKPPFKSTGSTEGGLRFAQVQYDTVTGYTNGSQVYMTYDNEKAYPAYLIKYR